MVPAGLPLIELPAALGETAPPLCLLIDFKMVPDLVAGLGDVPALAAAIDFIREKAFKAGVCCSAEPPHRLACLSMLERENVSEHIGHSALIFFLIYVSRS